MSERLSIEQLRGLGDALSGWTIGDSDHGTIIGTADAEGLADFIAPLIEQWITEAVEGEREARGDSADDLMDDITATIEKFLDPIAIAENRYERCDYGCRMHTVITPVARELAQMLIFECLRDRLQPHHCPTMKALDGAEEVSGDE